MSRWLIIFFIVIGVFLVGVIFINEQPMFVSLPTRGLTIGEVGLVVEVASNPTEQRQGLSGRTELAMGRGMLFTFDKPGQYKFWMKDMKFPLDFLWIKQGVVSEITTDVPAPSIANPQPIVVSPQQPVDAVIEVPAGWVAQNNIAVGNKVD